MGKPTNTAKTLAAVEAAYNRCGYRRAEGRWAGGEHEVDIDIDDGAPAVAGLSDAEYAARRLSVQIARDWAYTIEAIARLEDLHPQREWWFDVLCHARDDLVARTVARDEVLLSRPARKPSASATGSSSRAWSKNGKWSGLNSRHVIRVRASWRRVVEAQGLATIEVDGEVRLVLDYDARRGLALVAMQGRGFELRAGWVPCPLPIATGEVSA